MGFFSNRGSKRVGMVERDEDTLRLIQEARAMREEGHSIRVIRKVMAQRGLTGKSGRPLSVSTLHEIFGPQARPSDDTPGTISPSS